MCGIAGIFGITNNEPCDRNALQRAMDSMALRGPDDQGCFEAPGIALGHRRLAVIDVQGGRQPFTDPESGATIVPWISANYRSSTYFTIFNTNKHEDLFVTATPDAFSYFRPSRTNVYLGVKYTAPSDRWSVEGFVNNATDTTEFYWAGGGDGLVKGPVSMPRFYGIRATYNFGR